ncbi:MAG: hypothetical protein MUO34_01875 [Ignavibacteriaceae bacterium]|nr:hypothetical protein [Ignavibacteriaceae bacterium]
MKVFKTHLKEVISSGVFLLMTEGVCFWLVYGLMIFSLPIIMANILTVPL